MTSTCTGCRPRACTSPGRAITARRWSVRGCAPSIAAEREERSTWPRGAHRWRWTSSSGWWTRGRSTPWSPASPTCRAGCRASGCTRRYFVDEVLQHGTEACNYLLAVDVDMNTVERLRDLVVGARLRRLRAAARPRDDAPRRWLPATAIVQCDVLWLDGAPVRAVAAADPARPGGAGGGARLHRLGGHRARVPRVRGHLRAGLGPRLRRADRR